VLTIKAAKEIRGATALPPNPDLVLLACLSAYAAGKAARIGPVPAPPVADRIRETVSALMDVEAEGEWWNVRPKINGAAAAVVLDEDVRFKEFIVFMLAARGVDVRCAQLSQKRFEAWRRCAGRAHCDLASETYEGGECGVRLISGDSFAVPDEVPEPDALHAYLGLAAGLKRSFSTVIDYQFSSPLRNLLPALGCTMNIKSAAESKERDSLSRRLRIMQGKKKSDQGLSFSVSADFSRVTDAEAVITIPGDDILGSILFTAKSLVQKGNLIIENSLIETWATPLLGLIRKMGCRPAVQETGETSCGRTGMVQLQRFELAGRKIDCTPLYQYEGHVPAIAVLACFCGGQSIIRGLGEARTGASADIAQIAGCIRTLGGRCGEMPDGIVIDGSKQLDGFDAETDYAAPLSGALAAAALKCMGVSSIADNMLSRRWPKFGDMLDSLCEYRK